MKTGRNVFLIILSVILSQIFTVALFVLWVKLEPADVFENPDRYQTVVGTVELAYTDGGCLFVDVRPDAPYVESYSDYGPFVMRSCDTALVSWDALTEIRAGDRVEIDSVPEIFGDGWCYPVTGLCVNGHRLLGSAEGRAALTEDFGRTNRRITAWITVFALLLCGCVFLCVFAVCRIVRTARAKRLSRNESRAPAPTR